MSTKKEYQHKLENKLEQWNAEIDRLKAQADAAEADARRKYYEEIESLRVMQERANDRLGQLRKAGDDAWQDLKKGLDDSCDALASALKSASGRF